MIRVDVEPPDRIMVYIVRRQQRCFSVSPAEAAQLAAELGAAARELMRNAPRRDDPQQRARPADDRNPVR